MKTSKLTLTAILIAIATVGSGFSFPILGAKCAPIQHMVNILSAIILGPSYAIIIAFLTSLLRNLIGLGSLFAFPGSMCGALLAGLLYKYFGKEWSAYLGEMFGTSLIGGLLAYPLATFILNSATISLWGFMPPFFISTFGGTLLAVLLIEGLKKKKLLSYLKSES